MSEAVLFNPQVHVQPGHYRDLHDGLPVARERLAEASEAIGVDLTAEFFSDDPGRINFGPVVRPASLALAMALWDGHVRDLAAPDLMAGLSMGQITAACASGCLSFRDAVRMVHAMATIEHEEYGDDDLGVAFYYNVDLAVMRTEVEELAPQNRHLVPCAYTADNQMIVSGDLPALRTLNVRAAVHGGLGILVPYGPPAHNPLLAQVQQRFATEFEYLDEPHDPRVPLICNLTGEPLRTAAEVHEALVTQYTRTVLWDRGLRAMAARGVERLTIVGPGHFVRKSLDFTSVEFEVRTYLSAADLVQREPA
ncbi:ACP S-malonyltransferase [Lentzea sp. NPDC055074]